MAWIPATTYATAPDQPQSDAVPILTMLPSLPPVHTAAFKAAPEAGTLNDPPAIGFVG